MPILGTIASSRLTTPAAVASWDYITQAQPSGVNFVTFSSLPSGYNTFKILGFVNTGGDSISNITINGVTSNYYEAGYYGGTGSNASLAGTPSGTANQIRRQATNGSNNNGPGAPIVITFYNADSTSILKTVQGFGAYSSTNFSFTYCYGVNGSTSAMSSIKIATGNSSSGSSNFFPFTFYILYGMKEGSAI